MKSSDLAPNEIDIDLTWCGMFSIASIVIIQRATSTSMKFKPKWVVCCSTRYQHFLSTHADRQGVDISFTVCVFVCLCLFVRLRIS